MQKIIQTARLWLREIDISDAEALAAAINDFEVSKWLTRVPFPYGLDDARAFIKDALNADTALWVISFEGRFVGLISIEDELGYWLVHSEWGKGLMQEAAEAVVETYFAETRNQELASSHFVTNRRSKRVLEALGFQAEGEAVQKHCLARERDVALQKMRLTRADFFKRAGKTTSCKTASIKFHSERLEFRSFIKDDVDDLMALLSHYEVTKNTLTWAFPPDPKQIIERMSPQSKDHVAFCVLKDGQVIGQAGLVSGMFWYGLHPAQWRRGYGREIAQAMISFAFKHFDWPCLEAGVFDDNPASARVLEKVGMKEVGSVDLWCLPRRAKVRSREFAIQRSQWQQQNAPVIKTGRLTLKSLQVDDLDEFARIGGDARVAPMILRATSPWPLEDAARTLMQSAYTGRPGYRLGVYRDEHELIGCLGLGPDASIAYFFAPEVWGQGYASEALTAFVRDCFKRFDFDTLEADHFHDNSASGRVLHKMGFVKTGEALAGSAARAQKETVITYELERARFEALHPLTKP